MSELRADSRPKNTTAFWRVYMLSWAVLSGSALAYMIVHTAPPGSLPGSFDGKFATAPDRNQTDGADAERERLNAQVRSLNKTVASLRSDLAQIKQKAGASAETATNAPKTDAPQGVSPISTSSLPKVSQPSPADTSANTAAEKSTPALPVTIVNAPKPSAPARNTESAPSPTVPAAPSTASDSPATSAAPSVTQTEKPGPRRNLATALLRPGSVPPLPPYNQQVAALATNPFSENTTGNAAAVVTERARQAIQKPVSVVNTKVTTAPAPTAFGTPVVRPRQPATSAALSLSTAQSVTGLRASWLLLTTRHPNIFVGYQPRYIADQVNGNYRLIAGPIPNHSDADRICTQLRAQNVSCGVTDFVGSAL